MTGKEKLPSPDDLLNARQIQKMLPLRPNGREHSRRRITERFLRHKRIDWSRTMKYWRRADVEEALRSGVSPWTNGQSATAE